MPQYTKSLDGSVLGDARHNNSRLVSEDVRRSVKWMGLRRPLEQLLLPIA
jgi:hypothetical protein